MFIGRSCRRLSASSFGRSYRGSYYSFDVCDLTSLHKSLSGIWCWSCLGPRVSSWCVVVVLVVVVLSSRCPRRPPCFRCRCRCRRRSSFSVFVAFVVVGAVDIVEFWVKKFTLPPDRRRWRSRHFLLHVACRHVAVLLQRTPAHRDL